MASNTSVAHNWAHQTGKCKNGSNMHYDEDGTIYSYRTAVAQIAHWHGKEFIIMQNGTYSNSTSTHQSYIRSAIPVDTKVFYLPWFDYYWYGFYRYRTDSEEFMIKEFTKLYLTWVKHATQKLIEYKNSNKLLDTGCVQKMKDAIEFAKYVGLKNLRSLYVKKSNSFDQQDIKCANKFQNLVLKGVTDIKEIVCKCLGDKVWEAYYQRTDKLRHADKMRRINNYLTTDYDVVYRYPYHFTRNNPIQNAEKINYKTYLKHKQDGTLARYMADMRKRNLQLANRNNEAERKIELQISARERLVYYLMASLGGKRYAYKYGGGCCGNIYVNRWGEQSVEIRNAPFNIAYNGLDYTVKYSAVIEGITPERYKEFIAAEDKQAWIDNERHILFNRIIEADNHVDAETAERQRREQERRAKREYIENMKQQGVEGYRELYHSNLIDSCWDCNIELGNVFLRYNKEWDIIETSKYIRISVGEAKRLWKLVSRWHRDFTTFETDDAHCCDNDYRIVRYSNDILTAGCHQIPYSEMKYIADLLKFDVA